MHWPEKGAFSSLELPHSHLSSDSFITLIPFNPILHPIQSFQTKPKNTTVRCKRTSFTHLILQSKSSYGKRVFSHDQKRSPQEIISPKPSPPQYRLQIISTTSRPRRFWRNAGSASTKPWCTASANSTWRMNRARCDSAPCLLTWPSRTFHGEIDPTCSWRTTCAICSIRR